MKNKYNTIGFIMMWFFAIVSAAMIVFIVLFLFIKSKPFFADYSATDFIFGMIWAPDQNKFGIFPMLAATLTATFLSMLISLPLGILFSIFVHFYCNRFLKTVIGFAVNIMAAVPSVVYGLFGLIVIVPLMRKLSGTSGFSLVSASLLLSVMILPTIINSYISTLSSLPEEYYINALALGESKERSIVKCVFPVTLYAVYSSGILAVGRSVGETMAVLFIAGNAPTLFSDLNSSVRMLTTNISLEIGYAVGMHRNALLACGFVLLLLVLVMELGLNYFKRTVLHEN